MAAPEQIVCVAGVAEPVGVGFTITVAVIGMPGQPFAEGVIVKVTVTGADVVFVKLPAMLPVPLAAIPVTLPVLLRVQTYVVPVTFPLSAMVVILAPEQIVCEDGVATALGAGFTSTVAVNIEPAQEAATGVKVNVTVTGAFVVLVKLPVTLPVPLEAIPVTLAVLSRVQENIVPVTGPAGVIALIELPEQIVCVAGAAAPF